MSSLRPTVLLDNHWQALKIRILFWLIVTVGGLALWGGWEIFQVFGLSQADGGALKPFWQRLALGGFIAVLGLAAAAGMWLYVSLYALHVARIEDRISITTMTPFGSRVREFGVNEIGQGAYNDWQVRHSSPSGASGGVWVNAPWITMRAVGHRFPFIIDVQAEIVDLAELSVLAEGDLAD